MKTPTQDEVAAPAPADHENDEALWTGAGAALVVAGLAFAIYWRTAAPDLTWAHQGADGGDFLAAAVSNGVPHPSGYPLYTVMLRAWLWAGRVAAPNLSPARLGNLLSAFLAAIGVGVTVMAAARFAGRGRTRWWLAAAVALLWAASPLYWSQAVITEVYALHLLLAALLVCTILYRPVWLLPAGVIAGLGIANHLTFVLLLPGTAYLLWRSNGRTLIGLRGAGTLAAMAVVAAALYLRIPTAAAGAGSPPPVNWGYADNWSGFWWLVSGKAYRPYFADQSWHDTGLRVAAWARTLTVEYTPIGLAVAALGLTYWDRTRSDLRNFSLLWVLPVSVYAILYATRDSQVYLLPVTWMMVLWIAAGLAASAEWLPRRTVLTQTRSTWLLGGLALAAAGILCVARAPELSLSADDEATAFLANAGQVIEPGSIVVSSSDAQTFALWYGAWGSGELLRQAPGAIFVNDSLYQFDWYRRLQADLHPQVPGIGASLDDLLAQNAGLRPIYFAEPLDTVPAERQERAGGIWRYVP